ncbi:MAG: hypothetical protein C0467_07110 [Planctomycetaceae bacterium]|nr:hypothetical protein [Planctomycetaceae bacterium]
MATIARSKAAPGRTRKTAQRNTQPTAGTAFLAVSERMAATRVIERERYRAIARSGMNRDLAGIVKAAERLRQMIESFEDKHGETTALDIFAEAGLPEWEEGQDQTHLHWDLETLRDVKGFAWALAYFTDVVLPYGV